MKTKILTGFGFGVLAGIIDIIPMIMQNLTWDANLGAFSMWVVVGFFIATSNLQILGSRPGLNSVLKGIIYSLLTLLPSAFIIGWKDPISLIPIFVITLGLGGLLGFGIERARK